jgi:hypothetical protein
LKGAPFLFSREGVQTHLKEDGREKKFGGKNFTDMQGCQIFLGSAYQNGKNIPNEEQNITIGYKLYHKYSHKISQMVTKYDNISKIYLSWAFWYENIPFGNPADM